MNVNVLQVEKLSGGGLRWTSPDDESVHIIQTPDFSLKVDLAGSGFVAVTSEEYDEFQRKLEAVRVSYAELYHLRRSRHWRVLRALRLVPDLELMR